MYHDAARIVPVALAILAVAGPVVSRADLPEATRDSRDEEVVWQECFCQPFPGYDEFPASLVADPSRIEGFNALRMTSSPANPSYTPQTYIQAQAATNIEGLTVQLSFQFAVEANGQQLAFYLSDTRRTEEPADILDFSGVAYVIERDSTGASLSLHSNAGLVASVGLDVDDSGFQLMRIEYDDEYRTTQVLLFDGHWGQVVLPWTPIACPPIVWPGFGAFAPDGGGQFIDDICLATVDYGLCCRCDMPAGDVGLVAVGPELLELRIPAVDEPDLFVDGFNLYRGETMPTDDLEENVNDLGFVRIAEFPPAESGMTTHVFEADAGDAPRFYFVTASCPYFRGRGRVETGFREPHME